MRQTMTPAEAKLWFELFQNHQPRVRRQRPFGQFIVDFYCATHKIVIEVDGNQHHTPQGLEYDKQCTAYFEQLGLTVVRFTNREVLENFNGVANRIKELLPRE